MKTIICTPQHRYIEPETQRDIITAAQAHGLRILQPEVGNSSIAAARSYLARNALATGCDWILWWDADNTASIELVGKLLEHRGTGPQIIGADYWTRDGKGPTWVPFEGGEFMFGEAGQVYKVKSVGFGMTLTSREAFDLAAWSNCPSLPLLDDETKTGPHWFKELDKLQEDSSFCKRVRDAGGTVVVDTRLNSGHLQMQNVYWFTNALKKRRPKSGRANVKIVA